MQFFRQFCFVMCLCDIVNKVLRQQTKGWQLILKVSQSSAIGSDCQIYCFRNIFPTLPWATNVFQARVWTLFSSHAEAHSARKAEAGTVLASICLWPALGNKATKETGEQIFSISQEILDVSSYKMSAFDLKSRNVTHTLRWPHLKAIAFNAKHFLLNAVKLPVNWSLKISFILNFRALGIFFPISCLQRSNNKSWKTWKWSNAFIIVSRG